MSMRLAGAIFVAIHGLGHIVWFFSTWMPVVLGKEGRDMLDANREGFRVDPKGPAGKVVGLLSLAVIAGFGTTAWGIWTEASWWPPLLIGSAVASLLVIFGMWNPIKAPGPVSISFRALLADIGLVAATLMPWGDRILGAH
jgi:hypothetical protein